LHFVKNQIYTKKPNMLKTIVNASLSVLMLIVCVSVTTAQVVNGSFEDDEAVGIYYLEPVPKGSVLEASLFSYKVSL